MEKCEHKPIGLVIGAVLLLLVGFLAAGVILDEKTDTINVITGEAQEFQKTLSTSGTVEKMISPDQAEIFLSVETLNKSANVSQTTNATTSDAVRTALKAAGVSDKQIQTTSYTVQEQYEWSSSMQKSISVGYKTTNSIKVTITDLTKTGNIIDAAVNAGANRVSNISFTLSKEKQEIVKQEALLDAAKMSRTKAQSIASGLGVTLGDVKTISENYYYYTPNSRNYDYALSSEAMEAKIDTPISPSDVSISATVNVTFELK